MKNYLSSTPLLFVETTLLAKLKYGLLLNIWEENYDNLISAADSIIVKKPMKMRSFPILVFAGCRELDILPLYEPGHCSPRCI